MIALKLNIKTLPTYAKAIITGLPSLIIATVVIFLFVLPKQKEIQDFDKKIGEQNNQIAEHQAKSARIEVLMKESERLKARLSELKELLPEEKEISSLLKQVSDLTISSGLEMKAWRPGGKTAHPSGIVVEIPVSVAVSGTYHDFGNFLGSLTSLNRIVNIKNIMISTPQIVKGISVLQITYTAATFSGVPESVAPKK